MSDFRADFIDFALERAVIRFGEFTLKSGRSSPYFFNAGLFNRGSDMVKLCHYYAQAIETSAVEFDVLFGPAYKGIPLATGTAMALASQFQKDTPYCFNRKEVKNHGEGGAIVGAPLQGKVLIIDDVITAGTAIREAMDIIYNAGAEPAGVVIALDREEKGQAELSAIQEVEQQYQIPVIAIIKLQDLANYLKNQGNGTILKAINAYRHQYGISH
ncbi:MAG TPA: orotate phosphoribosyltransferase [Aeromonadales bacterium]|nr:orotate phosphoribosyltransferase [Aeromonadales bacterium]